MTSSDSRVALAIAGAFTIAAWAVTVRSAGTMSGGMPMPGGWSMSMASVVSKALDPIYVAIKFQTDREKRVARLKVPGLGEFLAEPIKNPVTGAEHRARIHLPDGFEYKEAEMGNCVMNRATLGDKKIDNQNTYAKFAAVNWSNG